MFQKIVTNTPRSFICHLRNGCNAARLCAHSPTGASQRPGELWPGTQSTARADVQWRMHVSQGEVRPLPSALGGEL